MNIRTIDIALIHFFRRVAEPSARFGLFVIFFWFGLLKVLGESPASPLVQALFEKTINFMPFGMFLILFGLIEMVIGILFLMKGYERLVILLLFLHMITTFMPLIFVPGATWTGFLIPTLEGQYIIKNVALISAAISIAAHLHPLRSKHQR